MNIIRAGLVAIFAMCMACDDAEEKNELSLSSLEVSIPSEGGTATVQLLTDAPEFELQNSARWVEVTPMSGNESEVTLTFTVDSKVPEKRQTTINVDAGNADRKVITVTQEAAEIVYSLSTDLSTLDFFRLAGSEDIEVTTDAPDWEISSDVDWLSFSPQSGSKGTTTVTVSVSENASESDRTATVTVAASYATPQEITVSQSHLSFPDYNIDPQAPDASGMSSTVTELAAQMTLGINIGNTLEAIGSENAWGNPNVNQTFVTSLKNIGFDAIRIPCSFDQYANQSSAKISDAWLARVKEVVDYCISEDLHVVLNIHWDNGWLENNVTVDKQAVVNARQKAYWEQIATYLRDYDERLIFASANEPHVETAEQMDVLLSYHQTFVDAVRSTGGRNSYRALVVQGPSTDIEKTQNLFGSFPTDEVADKLMMELHYYTPYQFTLMSEDADWGKMFYYWGENYHSTVAPDRNATWGEEADLDRLFGIVNEQFVQKGYPVILGEFGAYKRDNVPDQALHEASVEYFNKYVVQASQQNGIIPFYWGIGQQINRNTGEVIDQGVIDALLEGAGLK